MDDIEQTVAHVKDCKPDVCFTTVSYPIKVRPIMSESHHAWLLWAIGSRRQIGISVSKAAIPAGSINMPMTF